MQEMATENATRLTTEFTRRKLVGRVRGKTKLLILIARHDKALNGKRLNGRKVQWGCNSCLLKSHMRLREIDPITIGSRVKDTISCVYLPNAVGANSVHLRHETTTRVTA